MAELADAKDLKSFEREFVPVRVRLRAFYRTNLQDEAYVSAEVYLRACLVSRFSWIFERFFVRLGSVADAYSTEYM